MSAKTPSDALSSTSDAPATIALGRFQPFSDNAPEDTHQTTLSPLTVREAEVFACLRNGRTYHQIAGELCISAETVRTHCRHIYRKLGIAGRREVQRIQAGSE
jgi:DNA-binding CsgD family transcriptional regulator